MDDDAELNEIVLSGCVAHLERMNDDAWFLSLSRGRTSIAVWLARQKKQVVGNWEDRGDEPLPVHRWDDACAALAAPAREGEPDRREADLPAAFLAARATGPREFIWVRRRFHSYPEGENDNPGF